jgi:hypothetical protein
MLLLHVGNIIFGKVLSRAKARYKMQRQWRERSFVLIIDPIDSIINKHRLTQLEINWYFLMDPTPDVKSITNKHCSCLSFSTECIGSAKWNSISRWLLLYIYIVIYILYISCSMFFLTFQRYNIAKFVFMRTNLNWRQPGVRNVKISCVPTVAGTIPDLHQVNNTS